jgi:hypothetical protein
MIFLNLHNNKFNLTALTKRLAKGWHGKSQAMKSHDKKMANLAKVWQE